MGVRPSQSSSPQSAEDYLNAVALATLKGLDALDLGLELREFAADLPESLAKAVCSAPRLVAEVAPRC